METNKIMAEKEEDMISRLPDVILSQILSFLELKEAIKTSILSKRWEKVWTLIHRISLDNDSCMSFVFEEQVKRGISFINFVTGILCGKNNNRILSVTSFRLAYIICFQDDEFSFLTKWIDAALSPNLENLHLSLRRGPNQALFKMPRALFECQKLVTLNLSYIEKLICLDVPDTVCLPTLEMLRLAFVKFKDENNLKNLLLGCPILEELYLRKIYDGRVGEQQNVFVFSPSLKILRVDQPRDPYSDGAFDPFCSYYVVEAPKLENLQFVDNSLSGFTMTAAPCLVSAVIHIFAWEDCYPKPLPVTRFFQGISNIHNLELKTSQTIILTDELANLPELLNLIHLKIRWCENMDLIHCILQHSPHLKHLIFCSVSEGFDELFITCILQHSSHLYFVYFVLPRDFLWPAFTWSPPKLVPECLTSQIEIIEIEIRRPSNEEEILKWVEYFLDNGKVLKKMIVTAFLNVQFLDKVKELSREDIRLCVFKKHGSSAVDSLQRSEVSWIHIPEV